MPAPSFNGVRFDAVKQYLDVDFAPQYNSPAFYELLAHIHTYADSVQAESVLENRLASNNYFGNAIPSTLFASPSIGSQYLAALGSRLLGSGQVSVLRNELAQAVQKFSPILQLYDLSVVPDYKTGEVKIFLQVYDASLGQVLQATI